MTIPYIKKKQRSEAATRPLDIGELNYAITTLVWEYMGCDNNMRYADINEVIGVLECAKLELYRRVAAPYEDKAMKKNGDVYV